MWNTREGQIEQPTTIRSNVNRTAETNGEREKKNVHTIVQRRRRSLFGLDS